MNIRGTLRWGVAALACLSATATWSQDVAARYEAARGQPQIQFESRPSQAEQALQRQLGSNLTAAPAAFDGSSAETSSLISLLRLHLWHRIALDSDALDHTPAGPGDTHTPFHNVGPARSSRALGISQIAVFEAINSITGGHRSYVGLSRAPSNSSVNAAIAQASHDALVALYPSHKPRLDSLLARDLSFIPNSTAKQNGIRAGARAAAAILARRANDGSNHAEAVVGVDHIPSDQPGHWREDPISPLGLAIGARWHQVRPFVIASNSQFRPPAPPALTSAEYTRAFNEVKRLGGNGTDTPTERTEDQTIAGVYWGYDGVAGLGTPPRLYNQIVALIAVQKRSNLVQTARLFALVNTALADAGVTVWGGTKYFYDIWRPVLGVRESDPGTGPTGLGDGNPDTVGDPNWTPLGGANSNGNGGDFTPPFPAYVSGHATFGGTVFQTLRRFYRTDNISFTFVSDEFNGVTKGSDGQTRPLIRRSFANLSQAEEENGQSRIYLGVHWEFDKVQGIATGRRVANFVFDNTFRPK